MMLKTSIKHNRILNTLSTTLPDDRPITAIQIVEYIEKCPRGFLAISKTYDQDQDADLWREASFLKRKSGRYLCLSKSEGIPNFVVQAIAIVHEKSIPPEEFSLLNRTADTEQKAWRKKQLCYRLVNSKTTNQAITDIIVCNRLKKAPDGFTLAGEINGMTICYKMGNVQDTAGNSPNGQKSPSEPSGNVRSPPERPPRSDINTFPSQNVSPYPQLGDGGDHDYELLLANYTPTRPAPNPPQPPSSNNYNTLNVHFGLEGVPFVLSSKFSVANNREMNQLPVIRARTVQQLENAYEYDFRTERQS